MYNKKHKNNMHTKERKTVTLVIALALACGTANAQYRHRHHLTGRIVTIMGRPTATSHICNRFSQKERLAMATAYLEKHNHLTVRQYSKITQLCKASAEAELDAFAMNGKNTIQIVLKGKKKVYIKRQ